MAAEPTEEAIANFVSFTSTSREHAISFLKANNLDSQKAINAYFEDPTPPQVSETSNYYTDQNVPSFKIEHSDPLAGTSHVAPPSRPPSRINMHESGQTTKYEGVLQSSTTADSGQGLTLAEREERELQQAMAMSLDQNLGHQETGVTTNESNFGRATRDHYDQDEWAMTLFNASTQEVIISPDPQDRKRVESEPAFLRPSQDNLYLAGLLTILHSIPLAREALLLRDRVLSNYGHDPQWWNGQPINLPKIVTIQDAQEHDTDWDDILYETQRLVAFLDGTNRAFGSSDALSSLKAVSGYDSGVGRFLEAWQEAAVRATPDNQLATVFSSRAFKRPLSVHDTPLEKEFFTLDILVEPEHGQTLYDVLDQTMWSDKPGEELDDVWLEHAAEILIMRLENSQPSAKSVDVEIPAVFYADRYLDRCRELAREFRSERLKVYEKVLELERLRDRFTKTKTVAHLGLTSKETLEKAAEAVLLALPKNSAKDVSEASLPPEVATAHAQRLAGELRKVAGKIEAKVKELETRRQSALEGLREYSNILTEPSASPTESPHCKYTLRGVCTEPHVTYVLRRQTVHDPQSAMEHDAQEDNEWQWWRISFSAEDAKTRLAEKSGSTHHNTAAMNADVVGYTARKVQEVDVLRAAKEESKSVLLVYANSNAISAPKVLAPPPLQEFVNTDNEAFETEFKEAERDMNAEQKTGHNTLAWDIGAGQGESPTIPSDEFHETQPQHPRAILDPRPHPHKANAADAAHQNPNVFDYEVSSFEEDSGPAEEMKEKAGCSLLSQSTTKADTQPSNTLDQRWEEVDDGDGATHHVEYAK